jgi:hypothetical protein
MPKPKMDRKGDARLRGLMDRVRERASAYFPELDAGVRVDVRARDATTTEVGHLRGENERLKQLVAELSLQNLTLKKSLN